LSGSPRRFFELFRIRIDTFNDLLAWLLENTDLRGGRFLTPEFKLMILLWIIAYNEQQRNAAHMFRISQSTVSLIANELLDYFTKLCIAFVQLPSDDYPMSPEIELNPENKYFNGCTVRSTGATSAIVYAQLESFTEGIHGNRNRQWPYSATHVFNLQIHEAAVR